MSLALQRLQERGFVQQCTDEEKLSQLLDEQKTSFYVGVDPTGPSLHCGHLVPLMAMRHLQDFGHQGILLAGGGTARIGDPSGKSESRQMISYEEIDNNVAAQTKQFQKILNFSQTKLLNNKDWLENLNYIDFLREIGSHFSVNRMLSFEAYKQRLEKGLSFIEFNYQLLQSYDYLILNRKENCLLQIGGDDQWGNIVAGMELIRRVDKKAVYGLTFPLITTSSGQKMGKTEKGAIFLSPDLTSPYDFYQYWRNVNDKDVKRFLLLYTFLPLEECERLGSLQGKEINQAKQTLAYEVTLLIHGKDEADKAQNAAMALFTEKKETPKDMPTFHIKKASLSAGISAIDIFFQSGLCSSKSEARRLVNQGGAYIEMQKIDSVDYIITLDNEVKPFILRAGKKKYCQIIPLD